MERPSLPCQLTTYISTYCHTLNSLVKWYLTRLLFEHYQKHCAEARRQNYVSASKSNQPAAAHRRQMLLELPEYVPVHITCVSFGFQSSPFSTFSHCSSVPVYSMVLRESQPEKAQPSISVTLSGIVMPVRELQPQNAPSPMLVTLSGITMFVSELQRENTPLFNPVRTPYKIAA